MFVVLFMAAVTVRWRIQIGDGVGWLLGFRVLSVGIVALLTLEVGMFSDEGVVRIFVIKRLLPIFGGKHASV